VKTRLVPPLSPQQAADFYAAMLGDVLEVSARLRGKQRLDVVCAVHPPGAMTALVARPQSGLASPVRVVPQRGADLGERMEWALREAAASGVERILLRGSDSPTLSEERVLCALDRLEEDDLVVCPDLDGGYNLIGLREPAAGLFDHAMSTRTVMEDTLENANRLGLRAHRMEPGFDIDTAEDLAHLRRECARIAKEGRADVTQLCPRTLAFLDDHALEAPAAGV
jgi:hypothetical protein